ncbi:uncharacterized protein BDV17DRAFT_295191 [Aspergillus undulatus]|uniref:uncharacterized protein n=1 Tax=Aspergillus undulatus TaxID=1810928 RepID=UPI003CCD7B83
MSISARRSEKNPEGSTALGFRTITSWRLEILVDIFEPSAVASADHHGHGQPHPPTAATQEKATSAPFFWQADTAWLLFHQLKYTEAETYLSDRASNGFNVVLAVGFTQIGFDRPNRNGDLPFLDEDVTKPNEAYWGFVDSIVDLAWQMGIRVCLVPAWGKFVHGITHQVLSTPRPQTHSGTSSDNVTPTYQKTLVADTNPYWQNKTAIRDDYTRGGAAPEYQVTDWSPVYDDLANGIVNGER